MKKVLFTLIIFAVVACTVQQPISRADIDQVRPDAIETEGLYYFLPKTTIRVMVTAQKKIYKTGPFYRYSQRYLNLTNVITQDSEEWTIKEAQISTRGVPDPSRMFRITSQGTPSATSVSLTPEGILRGINLPLKTGPSPDAMANTPLSAQSSEELYFDDIPFTEEQLMKTSTAAMAEETAKEIYRIRDARRRLLESETQILPPDKGAYQTVLEQLKAQEQKFLSLFTGKTKTTQIVRTYESTPETLTSGNQVLFRFSTQKGFVDPLDVSGTPVYIGIKTGSSTPETHSVLPKSSEDNDLRRGLVYCIPAPATVKIIDRTILLTEAKINLAQFGRLHRLPAHLLDKQTSSVTIDTTTGGLLRLKTQPEITK